MKNLLKSLTNDAIAMIVMTLALGLAAIFLPDFAAPATQAFAASLLFTLVVIAIDLRDAKDERLYQAKVAYYRQLGQEA